MTNINRYISAQEKNNTEEKCKKEFIQFKKMLRNFEDLIDHWYDEKCEIDNSYKNHLNDEISYEVAKNKACNPCDCKDTNAIKDAFHEKLDLTNIRKQFLDSYRGDIPDESLNWIYKTFAYIEVNINNIISKE